MFHTNGSVHRVCVGSFGPTYDVSETELERAHSNWKQVSATVTPYALWAHRHALKIALLTLLVVGLLVRAVTDSIEVQLSVVGAILVLFAATAVISQRSIVRHCVSRRRVRDPKRFARFVAAWSLRPPFGLQDSGLVYGSFVISGIVVSVIVGMLVLFTVSGNSVEVEPLIAAILFMLILIFAGTGWVLFVRRQIRHVAGRNIVIDDIRALWVIDDQA